MRLAYQADAPSVLTQLGFDETSRRQGHNYLTVAVDLKERRVLHAVTGKESNTIKQIGDYLAMKGIDNRSITQASMVLSPAFIAGIRKYFPEATITFDRFHVVKLLNGASASKFGANMMP